jgi:hypothetical protein
MKGGDVRYALHEVQHCIAFLLRRRAMKKISQLRNAGVLAGFLACLLMRPRFIQAVMLSFLVLPIGLAEAGDTGMTRVIELHVSSTSPNAARDNLSAAPPTDNTIKILSQKRTQGALPKQRNPELSQQNLVIVGVNAQGQEISRTVMLDPRIIRAETAEPSGKLTSSGLLYRNDATFSVMVPDEPGVIGLKVYQPRWSGSEYTLDLIGEAKLPEVGHD